MNARYAQLGAIHAVTAASLCVAGCSPDARQSLSVPVTAMGLDQALFTAPGDVEVELAQASVLLSDLRLESPPEVVTVLTLPGIRSAQAHPGHDFSGDTACELLGSWTLDLLGEAQDLSAATCLEGELATGRVLLSGTPAVRLAGQASLPDGSLRDFLFEVELDEEVSGIPLDMELLAETPPAGFTLGVSPANMLSWADWNSEDGDGDNLLTLADGLLFNTVPFGAVSTASFTITVAE